MARALLFVRSQFGMLDDGARFHVISHLIRETVNFGKSMLASSIMGREESLDSGSNIKETGSIHNLIQRDRVLAAVRLSSSFSVFISINHDVYPRTCVNVLVAIFCFFLFCFNLMVQRCNMDQAVPTQPTLISTIVICFMSCRVLDVGLDVSLPMWHLVWPLVIFFV